MNNKKKIEKSKFIVDENQTMVRLDRFLFDKMPNVTRNKIQEGIKNKQVLVNKNIVKPSYKIKSKDIIEIEILKHIKPNDIEPEKIKLDIIYEDGELLIVNKSAGMVVHPAHENWKGTLVNALIYHFKNLPEMGYKGIRISEA